MIKTANSIEEAIQEAIAEIKTKLWVIDAEQDPCISEEKPCNYVRKYLNVFHKVRGGEGTTWSGKELYINKDDFTYKWHYGGAEVEPAPTPTKDFFESKIEEVKTTMALDHLEIVSVNEEAESAILLAIKTDTGNNAFTYKVKAWKTGTDTYEYKIIEKTAVG